MLGEQPHNERNLNGTHKEYSLFSNHNIVSPNFSNNLNNNGSHSTSYPHHPNSLYGSTSSIPHRNHSSGYPANNVSGLQWLPNWVYQSSQAPPAYYSSHPLRISCDQETLNYSKYSLLGYNRAPARYVHPELLPPPPHPYSKEPSQHMYFHPGPLNLQQSGWEHHMTQVSKEYQDALLTLAQEKYNQQQYVEALKICTQLYSVDSKNRHNLLLMGCSHYQLQQYENSLIYNRAILELDPNFPEAYSNMGTTYRMLGDMEAAIDFYNKALSLRPKFWDAINNLASLYSHLGRVYQAIEIYQNSIHICPNKEEIHHALGNLYYSNSQVENAKQQYMLALQIQPSAPVCQNLARIFHEEGNVQMAIQSYYLALKVQPNANCCNNLGILLNEQRRSEEAIQWYKYGLQLDNMHVHLYMNLGSALKDRGQVEDGILCYEKAIELAPDFYIAIANLANAYKDLGKITSAIKNYQKALQLKPDFPDAFCNYVHSLWYICDWRGRDEFLVKIKTIVDEQLKSGALPTVLPFHTFTYPLRHDQVKAISIRSAARVVKNVEEMKKEIQFSPPAYYPGMRLKIGYISSDFGNHPLSHLMQSVFGMHLQSKFEIFCYATSPSDQSSYRKKIEMEAEHFLDCSNMDFLTLAQKVHQDGIHILVNLNGYTKGARNEVFALQPSPIQVSYMGFAGTMGADFIQYMITDEVVCPLEYADELYTEKFVYMPHCYFVNDHKQSFRKFLECHPSESASLPTRKSMFPHLSEDTVIFANFNQMYKIDPLIFKVWLNILQRVPNSVLWLLRFPPYAEAHLHREAEAYHVSPSRIIFTEVASKDEHIYRGDIVDMFLDTPECNAHTTATDILWAGTPILTYPKQKMASRVAASIVNSTGFGQYMTAHSYEEYEDMAVKYGNNYDALKLLKEKLKESREHCELFDTQRWVNNLEQCYSSIWEHHLSGQAPHHMRVFESTTANASQGRFELVG